MFGWPQKSRFNTQQVLEDTLIIASYRFSQYLHSCKYSIVQILCKYYILTHYIVNYHNNFMHVLQTGIKNKLIFDVWARPVTFYQHCLPLLLTIFVYIWNLKCMCWRMNKINKKIIYVFEVKAVCMYPTAMIFMLVREVFRSRNSFQLSPFAWPSRVTLTSRHGLRDFCSFWLYLSYRDDCFFVS